MLADHELKELRFSCQQCGKCCGGESGFVLFSAEDVQNIIGILGISEKRFFKKYTRIVTHQGESYLSLK
jgi:Fe-S-cluster containining protein